MDMGQLETKVIEHGEFISGAKESFKNVNDKLDTIIEFQKNCPLKNTVSKREVVGFGGAASAIGAVIVYIIQTLGGN